MKKVISIILTAVMLLSMIPIFGIVGSAATTRETDWYTEHSSETTFEISTPSQLLGFSDLIAGGTEFAGKTVKLTASITLNDGWDASTGTLTDGDEWANNSGKYFKGTFDGQGYTISGIYLKTASWNVAIFARGNGTTIKNLVIKNSYIEGMGNVGGVIAITTDSDCTIENVQCDAHVKLVSTDKTGTIYAGGLVGCAGNNNSLTIKSSVFSGTVTATGPIPGAGGLVGVENDSTVLMVESSAFYGTLSVTADGNATATKHTPAGGLIGCIKGITMIDNCIAAGTMTAAGTAKGALYGATEGEKANITINRSVCTTAAIGTESGTTQPNEGSTYQQVDDAAFKALDDNGLGMTGLVIWKSVADSYPLTPAMSALLTGTVVADQTVAEWLAANPTPADPETGDPTTGDGGKTSDEDSETEAETEAEADDAEETTEVEEKRGCSSTALGGIAVIAVVSGMGVAFARKKKED